MEKEKDQVAEEKQPEVTETEDGGVEVSLEEVEKPAVEEKPPEQKEVKKPPEDINWKNKYFAQERVYRRDMEEIRRRLDMVQPPQPKMEVTDNLDTEVQTDWKSAVGKIASAKAEEIFQRRQEELQKQSVLVESQIRMEQNSQLVIGKHPELTDANSEKSQVFKDILAQHPERVTSVDGPLLTMYEMENELRKRGYDIDGVVTEKVAKEKDRIVKSNASLPSSRVTSTNKIVLTKEQREFCDENGIPYDKYARTQKNITGGGVTV